MIISYNWLLDYLPGDRQGEKALQVHELSKILTSIGLEVEAIEPVEAVKGGLEGLVIGEVLTCERHPNADKLSVTTVSIGAGPLHIVCGAPNVRAGQKVVVAPVGATVHPTDGAAFQIKKAKIRGEESSGMICAEDEIGLGKSHEGILVLPADAVVGTLAKDYFNIPESDFAIHIGLTPNRSDANSHIGVARDVSAYLAHHRGFKAQVISPVAQLQQPAGTLSAPKVFIDAPAACPRYAGILISGVRVGPSPEWLRQRLQAIEVRSINNIVDITNYVLHEYGQPLHAFDADKIRGNEIHARLMPADTIFTGLDGKDIKLRDTDLVIADAYGPIAIAGVFGGKDSGITESTTGVFLESAYFDPKHIRRTSLYHNLRTDAATHFEKGVDINNVIPALKRAAALICEYAGGHIASAITDVYPQPLKLASVEVTYEYIARLSGNKYTSDAIKNLLTASGFIIEKDSDEGLTLTVPSDKTDVSQPADIVEEILRIDGLDNVQIPGRLNIALTKALPNDRASRERIAELLCGMGVQEILTNSIVNSKFYPGRTDLVRMINSLSADLDVMRPSMLEGGLEVIAYNANRKNADLSLFEYGNVYTVKEGKYIQEARLAIWITGNVRPAHWDQKALAADIYYLKGLLGDLLKYSGIKNAATTYTDGVVAVKWKNQELCSIAQVSPARLSEFGIKQDVYFADINWDLWVKAILSGKVVYKEVPKFPSVQRDIAVIIDKNVSYQQIKEVTEQLKLEELHSFDLFDVFESDKLGVGKKSYALSYIFQRSDRTLTDAETEHMMSRLMDTYKNKLGAQIRE